MSYTQKNKIDVTERVSRFLTCQLGYTVPFTLDVPKNTGKKIHKLSTTEKKQIMQNTAE